jgi:chromosome segregation ATPase
MSIIDEMTFRPDEVAKRFEVTTRQLAEAEQRIEFLTSERERYEPRLAAAERDRRALTEAVSQKTIELEVLKSELRDERASAQFTLDQALRKADELKAEGTSLSLQEFFQAAMQVAAARTPDADSVREIDATRLGIESVTIAWETWIAAKKAWQR